MNGLNLEFLSNPVGFLKKYTIDNATWERGSAGVKSSVALSGPKQGSFDFVKVSSTKVRFAHLAAAIDVKKDTAIGAYFCPFVNGASSVGYVDVPTSGPSHKFVFTPAMHGCHLDCTTPNVGTLRVWHNQHPEMDQVNRLITGTPVSSLTYADYAGVYDEGSKLGYTQNAFNCLIYIAGVWHYLSQATFLHADMSVSRNNAIPILLRGV